MRIIIKIIVGLFLFNMAAAEDMLFVDDAYVRASLPGQTTTSAFLALKNLSDKTMVLSEIHTKVAETVELHSHKRVNDQVQMRKIENFTIAAKSEAVFRPGENHIMLIGIKKPLLENTVIKLEMCFDELCSVIEMPVVSVLNEDHKNTLSTQHQERQHQH